MGYGRKEILKKDTKIATINIGYADGLPRAYGNRKGEVMVANKKAKIIGNICMDVCMIDISKIDAKEGDEVIIFGNPANNEPSIEKMATKLNTIAYEILTNISSRVKKIYIIS